VAENRPPCNPAFKLGPFSPKAIDKVALEYGGKAAGRAQWPLRGSPNGRLVEHSQLEKTAADCYVARMVLELKLDLSDSLAQEARSKGLLEPPAVERMLRAELKRNRVDQLFAAADRLAAQKLPPLTEAEVETEIQAARSQRRAADASRR
jgi:hypothetical protein